MKFDEKHLLLRVHALQRMHERDISVENVREVLAKGEVIREYPDDHPYPSRLILAFIQGKPLHVVAADDGETTVLITAYVPDPAIWEPEYRRKRKS